MSAAVRSEQHDISHAQVRQRKRNCMHMKASDLRGPARNSTLSTARMLSLHLVKACSPQQL